MEITEIKKEQLNIFVQAGRVYCTADREDSELKKTIEIILPEAIEKLKKVENQRELFRLNKAKKTASKHLEKDRHGNYQYKEEDIEFLMKKMTEIDNETVKIHCHIVKDYNPEDISYDMKRGFSGIVIEKLPELEPIPEETEAEDDSPPKE